MAARGNPKWKKGCRTPNPGGRPKRDINLVKACKEFNAEGLAALVEIMQRKDARDSDRIRAVELIFAYGNGRPKVGIEITGAEGGPVTIASADLLTQLQKLEDLAAAGTKT